MTSNSKLLYTDFDVEVAERPDFLSNGEAFLSDCRNGVTIAKMFATLTTGQINDI